MLQAIMAQQVASAPPVITDTPGRGIGSGTNTVATSTVTLTTAGARFLVAVVYNELNGANPTITGITNGAGLTMTRRGGVSTGGISNLEFWSVSAPSSLSGSTFTATFSGNYDNAAMMVLPVAGVSGWDANVLLPAFATSTGAGADWTPSVTVSTSGTNRLLIYASGTNQSTGSNTGILTPGFTNATGSPVLNGGGSLYANLYITIATQTAQLTAFSETWGSTIAIRPVPNFGIGPYTGGQALCDALA